MFGISLLDDARIGTSGSVHAVDLADGASIDELRAQLDTIDGGDLLRLEPAAVIGPETRRAIDAQALGLWILAGLAGLVTIAALGQLLVRHARLSLAETSVLSSLGATRVQVAGETAARAGVVAAVAAAVAAVLAMSASGIFPFGFVRQVEPDPGFHGDALVLGVGALVLALGMVGWVVVMTRFRRSAAPSRRPAGVDAVAARCPTSAMATGVRFAFTSRDATSLVSRLGGVVLMAAGLVGTLIFALSLERLVDRAGPLRRQLRRPDRRRLRTDPAGSARRPRDRSRYRRRELLHVFADPGRRGRRDAPPRRHGAGARAPRPTADRRPAPGRPRGDRRRSGLGRPSRRVDR